MSDTTQRRAVLLDLFEQYSLALIFLWFASRMLTTVMTNGSPFAAIYLFDQLLVVAIIMLRRRTGAITQSGWEWFAGYAGTFLPLLVTPVAGIQLAPTPLILGVMLTGIAIHLAAKLTLRRSMGVVAANRGVKISGPYRLIRHPMYAGYIVLHIGLLLTWPTWQNFAIIFACWGLFVWRIAAEERVLSDDPLYREMKQRTAFRLVPGVY